MPIEPLLGRLREAVGDEHVVVDEGRRRFLSRDLSLEPFETAAVVVRPGSTADLARAVRAAHAAGAPIVARGGGMTYTRAYTPPAPDAVLIDTSRMDAIRDLSDDDLYVTVECGCTWERLYRALQQRGLRTPFGGTSSGRYATVGGTLSTNGVFLGCSRFGTAVDSVLGLEVVLGDGSVLVTGAGAHRHGVPFFRTLGPDLTGLFLADTGAFGVKAAATLRVLPIMPYTRAASFAFPSFAALIDAMREMARLGVASEIYSFDPTYNGAFVDLGFEYLRGVEWSVHLTVEAYDDASAGGALGLLAAIGGRHGRPLDPTLPLLLRDDPFGGVRWALLGREGEVWLPTHAILPFSRAHQAAHDIRDLLAREAAVLERHGIASSFQTVVVGAHWIFEVAFYWPDEVGEHRLSMIDPAEAARFRELPANPAARAEGLRLRREAGEVFDRLGGVHLQIGRYYAFESVLQPTSWSVLQTLKAALDPAGLVNPGSLGLASHEDP